MPDKAKQFVIRVDQSSPNRSHGKIVVDNAIFRLPIAWSVPEIFTIKFLSRAVRNLVHC